MLSARLIGGKDIDAAYIAAIMSPINKAPTEESRLRLRNQGWFLALSQSLERSWRMSTWWIGMKQKRERQGVCTKAEYVCAAIDLIPESLLFNLKPSFNSDNEMISDGWWCFDWSEVRTEMAMLIAHLAWRRRTDDPWAVALWGRSSDNRNFSNFVNTVINWYQWAKYG